MRCSRCVNVGQMDVRLNGKPLEQVDRFGNMELHVAADGLCERDVVHRMNERYTACGALMVVLCNRGLGIDTNKSRYM